MQQADSLEFFAGDAVRRLNIIPKGRPSLLGAEAGVAYPAYMARANGREAMRAGVISAPEGSTLTLKVSASQHLQSAEDAQGHPLRVEGSNVIIPNILLEKEPREIELDWMDSDGLAASRPVKIQLEPIEDKQPSIYLRGGENDRYVLEDTSIELEVEAADDFGLREMGVEWQGEKSFYDGNEDENGASAPKPAGADKPAPGLRGEKVLADGQPTQTGLKGTFLFQARALKLSPQRVVIRGFTQDYKPGGKRVYSEPMIIFVLSKSEHAQMIRNELERITSDLEGMIRRMDAMADEAKRLKGMENGKLKDAESQERLHALADEEQANRRELGDLLNRSESLFKEASRNSQIDPAGMKEFMKGISMLKPIPDGSMKMAQKLFRDSASEQESRKDLDDGENSHSEATQALKDTMNQLSKSAQDMEASTFVARLRQAASKEDSIAHALAGQINTIAGMTMEELDPSTRREMETIATLQNASTQDIGWILEDLSYYKSRTGERIYSDLYNQMNAFSLREKLDLVHGNILNAITARSIDESRLYASTLRHWAKLIDDYKKSRRTGTPKKTSPPCPMNTANFPAMILALSLPCAAAPAPAPEYSAKHRETASKLAVQQDELQADTSDLILGETNEEVVDLLKKCRHAMNDAVDLLEVYNTGGQTLAAQSDVIELIYQAAKAKMTGADGRPKPGGRALMDMLRQLLGMDSDSQSAEQQEGNGKGQEGSQRGSGNNPGRGANGKSNMASSQDKGVSNPDTAAETRSVPKSTGMSADDMPSEFRKALDAYNKTLQK